MAFDPKKLPPGLYAEFTKGPKFWPLLVKRALTMHIFDTTKLTDLVFYVHHPERIGNPLKPHETKLINEWKAFRTTITPWAQQEERAFNALPIPPSPCWPCGIEGSDVGP